MMRLIRAFAWAIPTYLLAGAIGMPTDWRLWVFLALQSGLGMLAHLIVPVPPLKVRA